MKRIAYLSPVNPASSGISDYSEELLPYLGQYADLTLYLDAGLKPSNPQLARHLALRPITQLERDQRRKPYDAILYHIGNSPVHTSIWEAMQRVPGILVLHDFVLHHFMLQYAAVTRRDIAWYQREAQRRYGDEGARIANLMLHGRFTPAAFEMPFSEDVIAAAAGLITHSAYVRDRALAIRPDLPAAVVPMGVPLPPAIPRDEARARLGLPQDALLLASFGHINPYKRVDAVLRALRDLRQSYDARYILVGSVSPNFDLNSLIARTGLGEAVKATGYVDRASFEDYVAAADICINLRHPTAGETSASLLRLLGAGRPTLVTSTGSFAELPPGVAAQVDLDSAEDDLILAYCQLLAARPDFAAALGQAARSYVRDQHSLDDAARGYMRFLEARYGWDETPRQRQPLWDVNSAVPAVPHSTPNTAASAPAAAAVVPSPLLQTVATALTGIGATEDDRALLDTTARALGTIDSTSATNQSA